MNRQGGLMPDSGPLHVSENRGWNVQRHVYFPHSANEFGEYFSLVGRMQGIPKSTLYNDLVQP